MIKKFKNIIINLFLYSVFLLIFCLITFFIIEKTVRHLRLAAFLPMGQNWDQLKLNESQKKEVYKKNNDDQSQKGNEKITLHTAYNSYLNYVTVNQEGEIYYRGNNKILENCEKENKIYLFGGSLVAGDGVPNDNDILSNKLTINSNHKNDNCYKYLNRGQSGHNLEQIFENIVSYHYNLDGDIVVIFGINSFINNIYSNQSHMLDIAYETNQNYLLIDDFKQRLKIFLREFLSKIHSIRFIDQFIKNDFKKVNEKEYWKMHNIVLDKETINRRIQISCDKFSEKAFLLKKFVNSKNKKIIFLKQPIVTNLKRLDKFEVEIKSKMEQFLFFMKEIETSNSYFETSYNLFLNECEKKFYEKELNFIDLDVEKKKEFSFINLNLEEGIDRATYFIDYVHMTPSGLDQLSKNIIKKLYESSFIEKL